MGINNGGDVRGGKEGQIRRNRRSGGTLGYEKLDQ